MKTNSTINKISVYVLVIGAVGLLLACDNTEDPEPLTGDVLIEVNRGGLNGITYKVYPEAYLAADSFFPPIVDGAFSGRTILIESLNPGNYILEIDSGFNWRVFLQVTAGQQRSFVIE